MPAICRGLLPTPAKWTCAVASWLYHRMNQVRRISLLRIIIATNSGSLRCSSRRSSLSSLPLVLRMPGAKPGSVESRDSPASSQIPTPPSSWKKRWGSEALRVAGSLGRCIIEALAVVLYGLLWSTASYVLAWWRTGGTPYPVTNREASSSLALESPSVVQCLYSARHKDPELMSHLRR